MLENIGETKQKYYMKEVENQLAHTLTQTEFDADYDKTAKKVAGQQADSGTDYEGLCR